MRILLSGYHNPHYLTVTEYIERAIAALGHELIVFNDRNHVIPGRLRRRWVPLQSISVAVINTEFGPTGGTHAAGPDRGDRGHRITRRALGALIRKGFQVVLRTHRPSAGRPCHAEDCAHYHSVFCEGTEYVEHLRASGTAGALVAADGL